MMLGGYEESLRLSRHEIQQVRDMESTRVIMQRVVIGLPCWRAPQRTAPLYSYVQQMDTRLL